MARRHPIEQPIRAQILVQLGPVDAVATRAGLPGGPLLGSGVEQAGVPGERDRDGAAVDQVDREGGVVAAHVLHALVRDPS